MSNKSVAYGVETGSNEEMKFEQRMVVIGEASTSSSPSPSFKGENEQTIVGAKRPINQVARSHLEDDEDHHHLFTKRSRLDVDGNDDTNTNAVLTISDNIGNGNVEETENANIAVSTREEEKREVLSIRACGGGAAGEPSFTRGHNNEAKEIKPEIMTAVSSRGRLTLSGKPGEERWRAHQVAEDYISLAGNMMLPSTYLAPFGYDPTSGQYPIERITALGILLSPLRRPSVVEKWSPYEISVFEASLALCGKQFNKVQKFVKTKNTKEIIEFYYVWKKTSHYKVWKKEYISPEIEAQFDDSDYDD